MVKETLPELAIGGYPVHYVTAWKLKDGTPVTIRPIRPEDEPLMVTFHQGLSERSVYYRYFTPLRLEQRVAHERLARICFSDYDQDMLLIVERRNTRTKQQEILGVARLSKLQDGKGAEFAIVIRDQYQNQGLGTHLLKLLLQIARDKKITRIVATILPDNRDMQHICRKAGFEIDHQPGDPDYSAEIVLRKNPSPNP